MRRKEDGAFRTPVEASFWQEHGGVTPSELKTYARKLREQVRQWKKNLEHEGSERGPSSAGNRRSIDVLDTFYAIDK
ncbi:hypothetical protein [Xanthomonas albilineans]|uniref:hypothetical protein n=1 Tax=Xanthomonas albilineans TaxID=29447 RepID=UPI0011B0A759|nr:hypothetical protein [Xanthomonas albilineans]